MNIIKEISNVDGREIIDLNKSVTQCKMILVNGKTVRVEEIAEATDSNSKQKNLGGEDGAN